VIRIDYQLEFISRTLSLSLIIATQLPAQQEQKKVLLKGSGLEARTIFRIYPTFDPGFSDIILRIFLATQEDDRLTPKFQLKPLNRFIRLSKFHRETLTMAMNRQIDQQWVTYLDLRMHIVTSPHIKITSDG
jgi:hypothetical protein